MYCNRLSDQAQVQQATLAVVSGNSKCQLGREFHYASLTNREIDCIYYLLRGKTAKGIGNALGISQRTVEYYLDNLKDKMNCHSKSELIANIFACGCLPTLQNIWKLRSYYRDSESVN